MHVARLHPDRFVIGLIVPPPLFQGLSLMSRLNFNLLKCNRAGLVPKSKVPLVKSPSILILLFAAVVAFALDADAQVFQTNIASDVWNESIGNFDHRNQSLSQAVPIADHFLTAPPLPAGPNGALETISASALSNTRSTGASSILSLNPGLSGTASSETTTTALSTVDDYVILPTTPMPPQIQGVIMNLTFNGLFNVDSLPTPGDVTGSVDVGATVSQFGVNLGSLGAEISINNGVISSGSLSIDQNHNVNTTLHSTPFFLRTEFAFTVTLSTTTRLRVDDNLVLQTASGTIDFSHTFGFSTSGPVFGLPAGFTAESQEAHIVDNNFVGLPEPSTLVLTAMGLLGMGFVTWRKKYRRV